jgi:predicted RNA-binding Zn-ribbon protein involved in translation (DUF1610 family)
MFKSVETKWKQKTCKNEHSFLDFFNKYHFCPDCGELIIYKEKVGTTTICDYCKQEINTIGGTPKYCTNCGEKG